VREELPLEFFIESDKLPIEAEPALEADDAKLSAPQGSDTTMPASSVQANRDAKKIIWTFRWQGPPLVWHGRMAADEELVQLPERLVHHARGRQAS
jgi:hypothetical protein